MKVLVVPDKFKGTLTAQAAAAAIAHGWKAARPGDEIELLPMSDGGDGFGEVMASLLAAEPQVTATVDAAHRRHSANWWWTKETGTALIESAQVIGLALLPPGKFHPFELDTFGLGAIVQDAASRGAQKILIGIGGSATNDGGFGLARTLGWKFFDASGREIQKWKELAELEALSKPVLDLPRMTVAVDVQNPLLGENGATRVYGPQKGLQPEDLQRAEACLEKLAEVVERELKLKVAGEPGAGAAGGLGFGLKCFTNACSERGFEMFSRAAKLEERIHASDFVITAEGAIDEQSFMGKGVGEVLKICLKLHRPCVGLAGMVATHRKPFSLRALTEITTVENAKGDAALWLERLVGEVARRSFSV